MSTRDLLENQYEKDSQYYEQPKPRFSKNEKIIGGIALAVVIGVIIYFATLDSVTPATPVVNINSLALNPLNPRGHLSGAGYDQSLKLQINKSFEEVTGICYPKCAEDPACNGFHYSIADRFDKKPIGNCWFMKGPVKYVDANGKTNGILDAGNWIKK